MLHINHQLVSQILLVLLEYMTTTTLKYLNINLYKSMYHANYAQLNILKCQMFLHSFTSPYHYAQNYANIIPATNVYRLQAVHR